MAAQLLGEKIIKVSQLRLICLRNGNKLILCQDLKRLSG